MIEWRTCYNFLRMIHEILPVGLLQCNCSILGDEITGEAMVIDPGDDIEAILAILARHKLRVKAIVITHSHIDHIGGAKKMKAATGAPVYLNENDLELYKHLGEQALMIGTPEPEKTKIDLSPKDGDTIQSGDIRATVIHTPGHTPGSICLLVPQLDEAAPPTLIAGDTLFRGSIGRTDLRGGSTRAILKSIKEKLLALDDDVLVIPGHGGETTIGFEREHNPFLQL
jgi:hydroxyacylglutathione hydrolase